MTERSCVEGVGVEALRRRGKDEEDGVARVVLCGCSLLVDDAASTTCTKRDARCQLPGQFDSAIMDVYGHESDLRRRVIAPAARYEQQRVEVPGSRWLYGLHLCVEVTHCQHPIVSRAFKQARQLGQFTIEYEPS